MAGRSFTINAATGKEPGSHRRGSPHLKVVIGGIELTARLEFFAEMQRAKIFRPAALKIAFSLLYQHLNGNTGRCDPSIGRLAKETGLTERSVKRAIAELEQSGWWVVGRNEGAAGRGGRSNIYRPNFARGDTSVTPSDAKGVTRQSPLGSERGDSNGQKGVTRESPKPVKNQENSETARAREWFTKFRGAYPSRGDHGDPEKPARRAFEAAVLDRGVDPEAIIAGAERYRGQVSRAGTEPRFVKMSANWLNDEGWADRARPVERRRPVAGMA